MQLESSPRDGARMSSIILDPSSVVSGLSNVTTLQTGTMYRSSVTWWQLQGAYPYSITRQNSARYRMYWAGAQSELFISGWGVDPESIYNVGLILKIVF